MKENLVKSKKINIKYKNKKKKVRKKEIKIYPQGIEQKK